MYKDVICKLSVLKYRKLFISLQWEKLTSMLVFAYTNNDLTIPLKSKISRYLFIWRHDATEILIVQLLLMSWPTLLTCSCSWEERAPLFLSTTLGMTGTGGWGQFLNLFWMSSVTLCRSGWETRWTWHTPETRPRMLTNNISSPGKQSLLCN